MAKSDMIAYLMLKHKLLVSSYKESCNNKPTYGYNMLPNLSLSPNLYKVRSVYNNNVAL